MGREEIIEEMPPTTIVIEGTPAQQERIVKMLQSYGLVNNDKIITPTQAENFYGYLKSQNEYEVSLEAQTKENQSSVDKSLDEIQRVTSQLMESNSEVAYLENDLENERFRVDNLEAQLRESQSQINEAVDLITIRDEHIKDSEKDYRRLLEDFKEVQDDLQDRVNNQRVLSDRILTFKQKIKSLESNEDFLKKKIERLDSRLDAVTAEMTLKRKRCKCNEDEFEMDTKRRKTDGEGDRIR